MHTNIDIDDALIREAMALGGIKTKKAVVKKALETFIRQMRQKELLNYRGSGIWNGDLEEMRKDRL